MTSTPSHGRSLEEALSAEQTFVDGAYAVLDRLRTEYRHAQQKVEAQGAWGTPQARTERDAKAAHYGDQAARMEQIEDRLVFGRLDMEDGTTNYIGRIGLPADDGARLLLDWRVPAARPFYQATGASPAGVVRRRHISTHVRQVTALEDDVLDAQAAERHELTFQGEGALMSSLASARDGRMGDIVATIQAEQDRIIRASDRGILVVQGGPGTGKTAVALHRAAYLLYNNRERLERSGVLLLGPSRVFLRYIEKVLPSLGENGVVSVTMGELLPGIRTDLTDPPAVAAAKGSLAWVETLRTAVRDLQRIPSEPLTFTVGGRKATLTPQHVRDARTHARRTGKPHNLARNGFALELMDVLANQLADEDADADTLDWWRDSIRDSLDVRREINLCWMPTAATTLLDKLYSKPEYLARVSRGLTPEDRDLVFRPAGSPLTTADVPLLDELEELLDTMDALKETQRQAAADQRSQRMERIQEAIDSQDLGDGIVTAELLDAHTQGPRDWSPLAERALADRQWAYGHIVVDEAQDLTPMAWHSLLRRCPSRSFTVVGDLDQARGNKRASSWFDALGPAARGLEEEQVLTISYRTPRTLTTLAQEVLAEVGETPLFPLTSARDVPDALADTLVKEQDDIKKAVQEVVAEEALRLDLELGEGNGSVGILVGTRLAEEWGAGQTGAAGLDQRIALLSVAGAKGLEFDTTILVEPGEVLEDGPGDLFVAMTRSTRRLHSVRKGPLPAAWVDTLQE